MPVHDKSWKWLLLGEHEAQRPVYLVELRRPERGFPMDRREAGRRQQNVLVAQGHVEHAGQEQDHLPARLGSSGLEEAQVA